jgi:K(+)-stimulated pyrophosphate-energized sodium pump
MLVIVFVAIILAFIFAYYNYKKVEAMDPGTDLMVEISNHIKNGANAFIKEEYSIIVKIAIVIAIILSLIIDWYCGVSFVIGALMSSSAGFIGMRIATIANVRVTNKARETKSLGKTLKVAFQGGSVMGLSVSAFALLGLLLIYAIFGIQMNQLSESNLVITTNHIGINFIPFTMTVSSYALGCSIIAMFDRVGGGIFTKAADMGADLVGKTELQIPEDDPRNPATIADNVGDNVGDVAGLGADLLESYVGSIISAVIVIAYIYYTNSGLENSLSYSALMKLIYYPIIFASVGLISSIVGIAFLIFKDISDKPHRELNYATTVSAILCLFANFLMTNMIFEVEDLSILGFKFGNLSVWLAACFGIAAGIIIGFLAEYYTSYDQKPTQQVAKASIQGPALTITNGLAVGMRSTLLPVIVLAVAILMANYIAGLYGVAMAAVGMLSFVASTVSVDTYGPIVDNAGGIAEMCDLDPSVREITDNLDSVGNTTAAIGKGFAIGSASLATLSLLASYLYSQATIGVIYGYELNINVINATTLAGALVGAAIPFYFSGLLIDAVSKAAGKMVEEVRRQFREIEGIFEGLAKPDYDTCIRISSKGALAEMKKPALISVFVPLVSGFIFGSEFVGGLLIGTTLSGIMLAIFTANAGGSWDNAKKLVEIKGVYNQGKGSKLHQATVVGDTVGDPLKDTVGPSLDILIKIMAIISVIMVSIFMKYNLLTLLF